MTQNAIKFPKKIDSKFLRIALPGYKMVQVIVSEGPKKIELHFQINGFDKELLDVHNFWLFDSQGKFYSVYGTINLAMIAWDEIN